MKIGNDNMPQITPVDFECYTVAGEVVPHHLRGGIERYILNGIRPGGFLCAVLRNDLQDAVAHADDMSYRGLRALTSWLLHEAPPECHGDREALEKWIAHRGLKGVDSAT